MTPWATPSEQPQSTVRVDNEQTMRDGGDIGATIPAGTMPQHHVPSAKDVVDESAESGYPKSQKNLRKWLSVL